MRRIDHGANISLDIGPITAQHFADVYHHVQLGGALAAGELGFVDFDLGRVGAMWKTDDGADRNRATGEQLGRHGNRVRFDAHARHAQFDRAPAAAAQLVIGEQRGQQRIIDHPGDTRIHRGTLRQDESGQAGRGGSTAGIWAHFPHAFARL